MGLLVAGKAGTSSATMEAVKAEDEAASRKRKG
jgi:hypothetical protein